MCYVLETVKVLFKIGGITHNVQLMCAFFFFDGTHFIVYVHYLINVVTQVFNQKKCRYEEEKNSCDML